MPDTNITSSVADASKLSRKPRIVLLANTGWYLFNFRSELIKELIKAGFCVVIIAPEDSYSDKLKALGAEIYTVAMAARSVNPLRELLSVVDLFSALRRAEPDVVCSFTVKCNLYAGLCRRILRFQQLANVSGLGEAFSQRGVIQSIVRILYKGALYGVEHVFFQNEEDLALCIEQRLVSPARSSRIPGSGVDLRRFQPSEPLEEKRRFLMFGRLVPDKGYDEYIQAARVLSGKYGERVKFSILGMPDRTRTQAEALFERIKDAAREGVVTYLEPCDEVEEVLSEVDCVVLPSLYNEGVPRSLLEGLGSAKVIVTTDWKGCRDTVIDDENGYLVPVGSNGSGKVLVEALCDKLEQVVELSRDRLLKMQRASRQLAENRFDEQQVIGEYLAKINSFLEWDAKEVAGTDRQLVV